MHSKELSERIKSVETDIENIPQTKPIKSLLSKIGEEFKEYENYDDELFSKCGFLLQGKMIKFSLDTNQYQQAVTLSRELLIPYLCKEENLDPKDKSNRELIEGSINKCTKAYEGEERIISKYTIEIIHIWQGIAKIRNDVNHAGMNPSPTNENPLIKNIIRYSNEVINLNTNKYASYIFINSLFCLILERCLNYNNLKSD